MSDNMHNKDHIERTKRMIEVMQAYVDGEEIEFHSGADDSWSKTDMPIWDCFFGKYRIAPSSTPDTINWDHVAPEFKYMARDENGIPFLYRNRPSIKDLDQWVDLDDICSNANSHKSYKRGTVDWKDSLVIRPGCE